MAEAKGCHDPGGPAKTLARALAQAGRIDITAQGRKVTVKRIAIATRWGMAVAGVGGCVEVRINSGHRCGHFAINGADEEDGSERRVGI